jgi:hypothetical protein
VAVRVPARVAPVRIGPPVPYDYVAVRAEIVRQLPELRATVQTEEDEMAINLHPASSYALIEDVVLQSLIRQVRAGDDAAVVRHCDLAADRLSRGEEEVQSLIVIGLIEAVVLDEELSDAVERLGYSHLTRAYRGP